MSAIETSRTSSQPPRRRGRGKPATGYLEAVPLANGETSWVGRVAGRKQRLGRTPDMTREEAQRELNYMLEQVLRGVWRPPTQRQVPAMPAAPPKPLDLRELVTEYLEAERKRRKLKPGERHKDHDDLDRLLRVYVLRVLRKLYGGRFPTADEVHNVPALVALRDELSDEVSRLQARREHLAAEAERLLAQAPRGELGREMRAKAREMRAERQALPRGLGPRRINKAVRKLLAVLDYSARHYGTQPTAVLRHDFRDEWEKVPDGELPHVTCGQLVCLLEAAAEQEATSDKRSQHVARVAPLAVLGLTGLRIGELMALKMEDVQRGAKRWRISVRKSKTDAGVREIRLSAYAQAVLERHVKRRLEEDAKPSSPLFATRSGRPISADNWRRQVFTPALKRAAELCDERGIARIPGVSSGEGVSDQEAPVTPHSLRRGFITHMAELGTPSHRLMRLVGHKDAQLTYAIYARVEDHDDDDRDPLLKTLYALDVDRAELEGLPLPRSAATNAAAAA